MTSKRLFANLLKENTKRRLWPIALSIAANFFAQIVYAVLIMGHYADRLLDQRTTIGEIRIAFFRSVAGLLNVPVLIIVVGMAFVIAMQGYFYLFDSKQTDLYYSLPVKRQKIFDAFNIIGILIFVIPYIICHIITVIMGLSRGYVEVRNLPLFAASALLIILEFLLCYEICVLAAVLTGHVVVAALGCGVFFFLGPIAGGLKESMMSIFFSSYYSDSSFGAKYFYSPIGLMYNLINEILAGKDAELRLYAGKALTTLILTVVVTVLCFVLSRIFINKRPAEAAGKAMAFEITKPVVKVAIMITAAIGGGLTLFYISNTQRLGIFIFGMICGIVVVHFVIETIYEFDFKASFGHFASLGVGAAISAFIFAACVFDIFGFETWQPMPSRVESVAFADSLGYHGLSCPYYATIDDPTPGTWFYTVENDEFALSKMELTDIESVEKITRQGAINASKSHKMAFTEEPGFYMGYSYFSEYDEQSNGNEPSYYAIVKVKWKMKNGKEITRKYDVNISNGELLTAYKNIYNSEEYKLGKVPVISADSADISKIRCETVGGTYNEKLDDDMAKGLIEAYKEDVMNQTFDEAAAELPSLEISCIDYADIVYDETEKYNMFVYPSFKKTMEFLAKHDAPTSWRDGEKDIIKATVGTIIYNGEDEKEDYWTSKDLDEITATMNSSVPEFIYYNTIQSDLNGDSQDVSTMHGANTTLSVDVEGGKETQTFGIVVLFDDSLPQRVKEMCFPKIDEPEDSSSVRGSTIGWMSCVSNG